MPRVNSTAIKSVRPGVRGFRITFHGHDGHDRTYLVHAPRGVYRQLRTSRSVGQTYNSEVKGKFPTRRVK